MKNIYNLIVCVAIIATSSIVLCGCGDDNDESLFLIKGNISNPTGNAVRDAEITLFSDTEVLKTATTDDSGNYEIPNVSSGIFNLSVQKDGYNNLTDIQVEVSGEDIVEDFLIEGNADIRGMVINSQTGRGLANALVRFTEGTTINATDTSFIDLSTTTDEFGNYEIEGAPIGSFLCIVYSEDFIPRVIENLSFEEGENDLDPNVLVESIGQGQIRIVLTWGALPEDLDTHLTGPQEGSDSRF
ncbi:MAG: carboxypeptidase-like regulatory domain-containing protein, partial [Bacteroidota bacterium]